MQSLKGKTALITGAGKGLGKAMALALANEGVNLILFSRTETDLNALANEVKRINNELKVDYKKVDVSDFSSVTVAVKELIENGVNIDILINNAGILKVGGFLELSVKEWEDVFKVNVFGSYYMMHEILPHMLTKQRGDIINIASTAGLKGAAKLSAYGASKAALINMSESLMQEARKSNVRVTTVNPSTIATDMTINAEFTDGDVERVLQPEDLAFLIVQHLKLPRRAFVKEVGLWSTNP
ncbi:3-ketoacyl-ACP reductase [Sphingobacterium sp. UT-1RO-CII-1]|uniref:3-ketoacyl-ACP reductase n=1 Tax=Sphingobacterium sp. UT-1RO-CII-1 TaxID=2995225 RepID=UPI00227C066E|nr:3-ketoacyl-ACP reductase [Sphingobacterium sp. UT-1RO-CII-1]MCY4780989.1 3-ketoacyl-ACP reductase [Sphingobacterium sp. UT-1RO-CII-1]